MTTRETTGIDPTTIVVAVDGSEDADRAVTWAAGQAFAERRGLTVVTAVDAQVGRYPVSWSGLGAAYAVPAADLVAAGRAIVEDAAELARHLHPALEITRIVRTADPRHALIEISRHAHMIVMGSRGRGTVRSKALGSVSAAVVREAGCPVVVCRPLGRDDRGRHGILLGVDGTRESLPVVEFAFQQASLSGLPLTAVHCVWDERRATHAPELVAAQEAGLEEHRALLAETLAGMAEKFPEVTVEQDLARGLAEEFLSADSAGWDLVVVGRHPVDSLLRLVTGAVATLVVERARAVVAVIPEAYPAEIGPGADASARTAT